MEKNTYGVVLRFFWIKILFNDYQNIVIVSLCLIFEVFAFSKIDNLSFYLFFILFFASCLSDFEAINKNERKYFLYQLRLSK